MLYLAVLLRVKSFLLFESLPSRALALPQFLWFYWFLTSRCKNDIDSVSIDSVSILANIYEKNCRFLFTPAGFLTIWEQKSSSNQPPPFEVTFRTPDLICLTRLPVQAASLHCIPSRRWKHSETPQGESWSRILQPSPPLKTGSLWNGV